MKTWKEEEEKREARPRKLRKRREWKRRWKESVLRLWKKARNGMPVSSASVHRNQHVSVISLAYHIARARFFSSFSLCLSVLKRNEIQNWHWWPWFRWLFAPMCTPFLALRVYLCAFFLFQGILFLFISQYLFVLLLVHHRSLWTTKNNEYNIYLWSFITKTHICINILSVRFCETY